MLLFYTGITRKARKILTKQIKNTEKKTENLIKMKQLSEEVHESICNNRINKVGESLHKGWLYKRELANGISNPVIDELYNKARTIFAVEDFSHFSMGKLILLNEFLDALETIADWCENTADIVRAVAVRGL